MTSEVKASEFKATCLALLDEVKEKRLSFIVTKRGRPVAKLVPIDEAKSLESSVTVLSGDDDELFSTGERWSVD